MVQLQLRILLLLLLRIVLWLHLLVYDTVIAIQLHHNIRLSPCPRCPVLLVCQLFKHPLIHDITLCTTIMCPITLHLRLFILLFRWIILMFLPRILPPNQGNHTLFTLPILAFWITHYTTTIPSCNLSLFLTCHNCSTISLFILIAQIPISLCVKHCCLVFLSHFKL